MKNNKLKIAFTIFTLLLTISLYAQGPPGRGQGGGKGDQKGGKPSASEILSKLDTNKDDLIDKDEASNDERVKIANDFDEIDINDDDFIDIEELNDALNSRSSKRIPKNVAPEKLINQIDDDGNGKLNELEVAAKGKQNLVKNFKTIDANQDHELDLQELKAFFSENAKSKRKRIK